MIHYTVLAKHIKAVRLEYLHDNEDAPLLSLVDRLIPELERSDPTFDAEEFRNLIKLNGDRT